MSKVKTLIPVLKFSGEWSPGSWCQVWSCVLSFLSSFLCLSLACSPFAVCRPHIYLKNLHWFFQSLFRLTCVKKKGLLILDWVGDGRQLLLLPKKEYPGRHYFGKPTQSRIIKSYQIFLSLSLGTKMYPTPVRVIAVPEFECLIDPEAFEINCWSSTFNHLNF